jgi:hypothetical protein
MERGRRRSRLGSPYGYGAVARASSVDAARRLETEPFDALVSQERSPPRTAGHTGAFGRRGSPHVSVSMGGAQINIEDTCS